MERQRGIYGKGDSGGSHPQGEKHDLQMEWGSSKYDAAYVCAEEEKDMVRAIGKLSFPSWYRYALLHPQG